jgi:hypothetical protein
MFAERKSVTITTDAEGDGTGYISVPHGRVMAIHYVKIDYENTVDFAITAEATGEAIWSQSNVTASVVKRPRAAVHDVLGAAALFGSGGTAIVEPIFLANDRIKIVIDEGGATKSGTFIAVIG